jgi:hypothetical protein
LFSRISRYRSLPDVVTDDARGRTVASKSLRLLPDVAGTFQHLVAEGERLDHLGVKYYQQPRKWWRICDANPEFLSPLELIGEGPVVTVRFERTPPGGAQPQWATLATALADEPGVERFRFVDDVHSTREPQTIGGQQVTVTVERHTFAVLVTYNQLVVGRTELASLLAAAGFQSGQPQLIGQVGRRITIPPDVVT